jgi:hypothetical protein
MFNSCLQCKHTQIGLNSDVLQVYHAYYQWVPFVLFLQGVMFYLPHYLWKVFEVNKPLK